LFTAPPGHVHVYVITSIPPRDLSVSNQPRSDVTRSPMTSRRVAAAAALSTASTASLIFRSMSAVGVEDLRCKIVETALHRLLKYQAKTKFTVVFSFCQLLAVVRHAK